MAISIARAAAAAVIAAMLAGGGVAGAGSPATPATAGQHSAAARAVSPSTAATTTTAAFSIADGAAATRTADVTITVAPPTGTASLLRLTNDGGTTWETVSYATTLTWSLIDPAAGGTDTDGAKTVAIEAGTDAGPWAPLGASSIMLDRVGPTVTGLESGLPHTWLGELKPYLSDAGVGVARSEVSLDGVHWRSLDPAPNTFYWANFIDYREGTIGGSWVPGPRTVYIRAFDKLGNVGPVYTQPDNTGTDVIAGDGMLPAMFNLPLPAVVGRPFTIEPVMNPGYSIPPNLYCFWQLYAGDEAVRLDAAWDPTLIRVDFSVPSKNGTCAPWTFTLPYTPALEYTWILWIGNPAHAGESVAASDPTAGSFRAEPGTTTSRAITSSNLPLYYMLPDDDVVATDGTVTYRIYAAGGAPTRSGLWSCEPSNVVSGPNGFHPQEQTGGSSFKCNVTSTGPWEALWVTYVGGRRWLVQYDPYGDRRKPTVTAPVVLAGTWGSSATNLPVTVAWTGHDVGTGIARYQVQRSVNGGAWTAIALASPRAKSVDLWTHAGASYRFRVRAEDRTGNWSAWAYGATIRVAKAEETSGSFTWSSGWTRVAAASASGGAVRSATAARRAATFRFSGRAVGWIARRGPGEGFAQVWVDGKLATTVSLETPTAQAPKVVFRRSWAAAGSHAVRIVVLGTAGRPTVEIDAFMVVRG